MWINKAGGAGGSIVGPIDVVSSYKHHGYSSVTATSVDANYAFADANTAALFNALEVTVFNDGLKSVFVNFNAAATVSQVEMLAGEAYNFLLKQSNGASIANIHFICKPAETTAIRIYGFGN